MFEFLQLRSKGRSESRLDEALEPTVDLIRSLFPLIPYSVLQSIYTYTTPSYTVYPFVQPGLRSAMIPTNLHQTDPRIAPTDVAYERASLYALHAFLWIQALGSYDEYWSLSVHTKNDWFAGESDHEEWREKTTKAYTGAMNLFWNFRLTHAHTEDVFTRYGIEVPTVEPLPIQDTTR